MLNFDSNEPFLRSRLARFSGIFSPTMSLSNVLLALSCTFLLLLGSTFAANINLNNNKAVEFGQGVVQTTACDEEVTITPYASFVNESGGGSFYFTSISVSGIGEECDGKIFTIKAYKSGDSTPLDLYTTSGDETYSQLKVYDNNGNFSFVDAGLLEDDIQSATNVDGASFTITMQTSGPPPSSASALASDVDRITIESNVGSGASPSPTPSPSPNFNYSFGIASFGGTGYSFNYIGQTFTIPAGKSGQITAISDLSYYLCLLPNNINAVLKIYDSVSRSHTYAEESFSLVASNTSPCGATPVTTIVLSTPISVTAGQTLYLEIYAPNNYGATLMSSADSYAGGQIYVGDTSSTVAPLQDLYPGAPSGDLYFSVNMFLTP